MFIKGIVSNSSSREKCRDAFIRFVIRSNSTPLTHSAFLDIPRCVTREFRTRSPIVIVEAKDDRSSRFLPRSTERGRAAVRINSETDVRVLQRPAPPGRARPLCKNPGHSSRARTPEACSAVARQKRFRRKGRERVGRRVKAATRKTRIHGGATRDHLRQPERSFSTRQSWRIKEFWRKISMLKI